MNFPEELKYSKSHEWVKVEGDTGIVGITDFAQAELGDVVYVEASEVGSTVTAGETAGTVESVKAVSDINSPVSGAVSEFNSALEDAPEALNTDPYGSWIFKVKMSDPSEVDSLMDAAAYAEYTAASGH